MYVEASKFCSGRERWGCFSASLAGLAAAQSQSAAPAPATASDRSDESGATEFLARKRENQSRRDAVLAQRGVRGEDAQIRQLYKSLGIARPKPRAELSAGTIDALDASLETDAVQLLQSLGFKPGRLRQLAGAGVDPVAAAAAYIRGSATLAQQALLAETVVVARVSALSDEQLGDGFRSTVTFEVVDTIVGPKGSGAIGLRQMSGSDGSGARVDVSSDLSPKVGDLYLLMLSSSLYDQLAAESGGRAARGATKFNVLFGSSYIVQSDVLVPAYPGAAEESSLAQLKSALTAVGQARGTGDTLPN